MKKLTALLLLSAVNLCVFSAISGLSEAYKVKMTNYYSDSKFALKDGTKLKSENHFYYIGKTQNYLFFYSQKKATTTIIPVSELKSMQLSK
ncbi:hypothetical protein [Nonlabens sp. SY33080]|uniref:hypothetical protein n=1 Tax=Nonlabens sp. SY33080 TaxID=2719911 RepID=UPI0014289A2B|nr:hypothetical protein [Nonlabens sp. SY33080]